MEDWWWHGMAWHGICPVRALGWGSEAHIQPRHVGVATSLRNFPVPVGLECKPWRDLVVWYLLVAFGFCRVLDRSQRGDSGELERGGLGNQENYYHVKISLANTRKCCAASMLSGYQRW